MKSRIFILAVVVVLILVIGYFVYYSYFYTPPRKVVDSFLHLLLIDKNKEFSKFLVSSQIENPFILLTNEDVVTDYKIVRTEKLAPDLVNVWVSFKALDNKVTVPFKVIEYNNQWYISQLPQLKIYKHGVLKEMTEEDNTKKWVISIGTGIIELKVQPELKGLKTDTPISFITLDDKLLHYKELQPLVLSKVLSLTNSYIEDIELGSFDVGGSFPVYEKVNDSLIFVGDYAISPGTPEVTLFRSKDGVGRMAVIKPPAKYNNKIRVLLNNTDYSDNLHDSIKITSNETFTIVSKVNKIEYVLNPGDNLEFKQINDEIALFKNGTKLISSKHRWFVYPSQNARLKVLNIGRSHSPYGTEYRGTLEVGLYNNKLTLINEVNIEEYLYSVVPSEMPVHFGLEALKVQAVCARAYAVRSMLSYDYRHYGAHLEDSTASQVYNNMPELDIAIKAVDETSGIVPFFEGQVINACFFSTSCGYTASAHEVWSGKNNSFPSTQVPYLSSAPQYPGDSPSLYNEKNFRAFINQKSLPSYDRFSPFFRWNVTFSRRQLEEVINNNLPSLYKKQPAFVLTRTGNETFKSVEVPETIGELQNIEVIQRGTGGNIMTLDITTTHGTFRIIKEYNIRQILKPVNYIDSISPISLNLYDGTSRQNFPLLPSAFAYIDFTRDTDGNIEDIIIHGGGYGHGVGMSQHGTYGLTLLGKSFGEILEHYYPKCQLKNIYKM